MRDQDKTQDQLIDELNEMRRKVAELETAQATVLDAENAPMGYQSLDENGHFLAVNQAWLDTLGYSREEVIGKWFGAFLGLGYQDHFNINFPRFKTEGEIHGVEFEMVRKDGSIISVAFDGRIALDRWGRFKQTHCILQDITVRNQAEKKLRESEERYRAVFENAGVGIDVLDQDGRIISVNKAMCDMLGYSVEEFKELTFSDITHPDDKEISRSHLQALMVGDIDSYKLEKRFLRKNGDIVWGYLSVSAIRNAARECAGAVGVIADVTEQKRAEQGKLALQTQLFQSQKMEALGTLVGGVAHDFNNMLQSILGYSEMLLIGKKKNDPDYNDLQTIIETGKGGAELVKKLLAFGQQAQIIPVRLDLNQQITQISPLISRTLPQVVEVELDLADGLAPILADHNQIDQVVMNLAINASEAMPNGGRLKIATRTVSLDEEYCRRHHEAQPGGYAMLSVKDSGRGVDKETLTRIFDPFFSTKQRGAARGTGLGLAVVQGIVEQQGGHVTCESEPGIGTEFRIYFPAIDAPLTTAKTDAPVVQSGGTETILVVEDSSTIAEFERKVLEKNGYNVVVAISGKEALDIYKTRKEEISLVILDLLMPEMSGRDCLMELLKIDPSVKALIASGYSPGDELHNEISPLVKGFVHKPFTISELLNKARSVMDSD